MKDKKIIDNQNNISVINDNISILYNGKIIFEGDFEKLNKAIKSKTIANIEFIKK